MNPNVGTLFGTYEFLEEFMGVRWLWPGELGTYVPKTNNIEISSVNKLEAPHFNTGQCDGILSDVLQMEVNLILPMNCLDFRRMWAQSYGKEVGILFRKNRMGGLDIKPPTGHRNKQLVEIVRERTSGVVCTLQGWYKRKP